MSLQITISINGQEVRMLDNIPWHQGTNVQDAMESAYGMSSGYSFVLQYFGKDLGYEAITIDGISSQSGTDEYLFWQLSVDGTVSPTGIDETIVEDGATIEWNYTRYVEEEHGQTRHAAIRKQVLTSRS